MVGSEAWQLTCCRWAQLPWRGPGPVGVLPDRQLNLQPREPAAARAPASPPRARGRGDGWAADDGVGGAGVGDVLRVRAADGCGPAGARLANPVRVHNPHPARLRPSVKGCDVQMRPALHRLHPSSSCAQCARLVLRRSRPLAGYSAARCAAASHLSRP
jgi:hypothetical protein